MQVSQPIEQRVNEMIAGSKGEVAVKVYGDDFGTLADLVGQVDEIIKGSARRPRRRRSS